MAALFPFVAAVFPLVITVIAFKPMEFPSGRPVFPKGAAGYPFYELLNFICAIKTDFASSFQRLNIVFPTFLHFY
jgi:hypothetical protein